MENLVEVRNVNKNFNLFALKDVSFEVKKGFITGFIGPNGAGKTTVIRCLMNLLHADSGEIRLFGKTHQEATAAIKQKIGFVYDNDYFYEELSMEQNKRIIAPFYEDWNEDTFQTYMKRFRLPQHQKVKKLSRGMKIKFSLAIALSHNPQLIIMDEPTSGLDPVFRRELLTTLQDIMQDEDKAIFFSTHITTDLEKIADYLTFIHDGRIIFSKEKDDVLDEYAVVKGQNDKLTDTLRSRLIGIQVTDVGFEGLAKDKSAVQEDVLLERATLEDIIFYTVKEDTNADPAFA